MIPNVRNAKFRIAATVAAAFMVVAVFGCGDSLLRSRIKENRKQQVRNAAFWATTDLDALLERFSTTRVRFSEGCGFGLFSAQKFEVTGTETGAVLVEGHITDYDNLWGVTDRVTLKLDMEEWHGFLTSLYNSGINTWRAYYDPGALIYDGCSWGLEISSDGYSFKTGGYVGEPPELPDVRRLIYDLRKRMTDNAKEKTERWLEREYERRFGETITDFARSVTSVGFCIDESKVTIDRTNTGHFRAYIGNSGRDFESRLELGVWDWLDFVKDLGESLAAPSEEPKDGTDCTEPAGWCLDIAVTDERQTGTFQKNSCTSVTKVLNDMKAKITRYADNRERDEAMGKLPVAECSIHDYCFAEKYKDRVERDANIVEVRDGVPIWIILRDTARFIELRAEEFCVLARLYYADADKGAVYEALLNVDDWLDFIIALNESGISEMEKMREEPGEWMVDMIIRSNTWRKKTGGETYPPNWGKLDTLMNALETKITENAYKK